MIRLSFQKITTCLIAGLVCGATFFRIGARFLGKWISLQILIAVTSVILLTAIGYAFKWIWQKGQDNNRAAVVLAFWQGVIRYSIALDLIMFGLQKFFWLQFSMPLGMLDLPFSSFSGEDLTFAYFAHSFVFVVLIGSFQVSGSLLLLFSRTKLVGTIVLLPVMLNIVLLLCCFGMETGELVHALILLAALLYLLFSEYNRLVEFFFRAKNKIPSVSFKNNLIRNSIRFSAVYIPLLLLWSYNLPQKHPAVYGKYLVSQLLINQKKVEPPSCKDSVLTVVYLDQNADCVFEYNSQQKRLIGNYQLDEKTNKMIVVWRSPAGMQDTLFATISSLQPGASMNLSGKMGNQFLEMGLVREKK